MPVELGWKPTLGPDKLPGNYRIGYYYSSANGDNYGSWRDGAYQRKIMLTAAMSSCSSS